MKSLKTLAVLAIAALALTACDKSSAPKASLKTDIDSLSYAAGIYNAEYARQAIQSGQVIDTAYIDELVRGINEGANAGDDKKKQAYILGLQIGQGLSEQMVKGLNRQIFGDDTTQTLSLKNVLAGYITGLTGKKGLMTAEQAQVVANTKMEAIHTKTVMKKYGANKAAGEKFLAENKKKAGVVTLPSGVQYKVLKEGHGKIATDSSQVTVNYEGRTIDGKVFETTYRKGGQPMTTEPRQMIKGWTEVLTRMPEGSAWEVYIPQNLAYGANESGPIKPFSVLIFKIEVVKVADAKPAQNVTLDMSQARPGGQPIKVSKGK